MYQTRLLEKLSEAIAAVMPIVVIVLILSLTIAPMPSGTLLAFLFGGALLLVGMMFFSLGAELAMEPMGQHVGAQITKTKKLALILGLAFLLGLLITVSEPDLQVLSEQVQSVPRYVLIFSVAGGVGFFLVLALLRMLFQIRLRTMLLISYALVFALTLFVPSGFLAVSFDAGGVTTGPMTVPFIMAFGIGISSIRRDSNAEKDSFGLIALCSVGPVLAVLLLSVLYAAGDAAYTPEAVADAVDSVELGRSFLYGFPTYLGEIAVALLPIMLFFLCFQLVSLHLGKQSLIRIGIGLGYTYIGLVLFLTGVNVGFMPAGTCLGGLLAALSYKWIIVPLGMLMGYFIVKAEPAVYVLMRQVEELTSGSISGTVLQRSLSVSVAVSTGLAMVRVLTGLPVMAFLAPGYALALGLTFVVPDIFTAIAFDSGGVASGPMTATFLLPFATGACVAVGGNVVTDAFGVIAMVAMTPLITIQCLGVAYRLRQRGRVPAIPASEGHFDALGAEGDYAIIEL